MKNQPTIEKQVVTVRAEDVRLHDCIEGREVTYVHRYGDGYISLRLNGLVRKELRTGETVQVER